MDNRLINGDLKKTMLRFSLPFLASYFLQTLYGMADLFIVGQFDGTAATTAVSLGSQIMHMITVIIVGLAMGATVRIGHCAGAGDEENAGKVLGNSVVLFASFSVVLALILLACLYGIIRLISVPEEAVAQTAVYLRVCIYGIPFITAYNIFSSILRGLGDSKKPMYVVACSCVLNIAFDYLFIGAMHMGAAGAALGTTLSQSCSVVLALLVLSRKKIGIKLRKEHFKPDPKVIIELLKVGIPVACQDGLIQVSFIVISIIANMRGLIDAAAVGIVEKIICFIFLVPSTLLSTVSALAAQNIGAGKHDRAARVLRLAVATGLCYGASIGILVQFVAPGIVGLFSADGDVVIQGALYIRSYVWDCMFAGVHFAFSGYFCAYGRSGLSFIHNIASILILRIPLAWIFSVSFPTTLLPMGFAPTLGSVLSVLICTGFYLHMQKKINSLPVD